MAVHFPAFCPNCGLIFPSRLLAIDSDVTNVVLAGNRETCPRCGASAELPDGTFDVVGDTIQALSTTPLTRERLVRLQGILEAAQAGRMTDEEATQAIADEAPEVGSLLRGLRPKMGKAVVPLLTAVLTILAGQGLPEYRDDSATREDVRRAVEEAVQRCQEPPPDQPGPWHRPEPEPER